MTVTGHADMFQTISPKAQEIERQIQRVWAPTASIRTRPEKDAPALLSRLEEITVERGIPFRSRSGR